MMRCTATHPTKKTQCGLPAGHTGTHQNGTICASWNDAYDISMPPETISAVNKHLDVFHPLPAIPEQVFSLVEYNQKMMEQCTGAQMLTRPLITSMKCKNHPDRNATFTNSIPDRNVQGYNTNESGYNLIHLCDECAAVTRMYVGNTARLEAYQGDAGDENDSRMERI